VEASDDGGVKRQESKSEGDRAEGRVMEDTVKQALGRGRCQPLFVTMVTKLQHRRRVHHNLTELYHTMKLGDCWHEKGVPLHVHDYDHTRRARPGQHSAP